MKRFISTLVIFFGPLWAHATTLSNPVGQIGSTEDLIGILIQIFQLIVAPIVVIYLIYAGFLMVTAGGDEKKLADGKRAFMWGMLGAVIVLGAAGIQFALKNTADDLGIAL